MSEPIRRVYDLAKSAVTAKEQMAEAVQMGYPQQYKRVVRLHPEQALLRPLLDTRKRLTKLTTAGARDEAEAIAEGALLWVDEQLLTPQEGGDS